MSHFPTMEDALAIWAIKAAEDFAHLSREGPDVWLQSAIQPRRD
jgi:hypothetical protein